MIAEQPWWISIVHELIVARCRQSYEREWRFHVRTATYAGPEAVYKDLGLCHEATLIDA
jgi:hypothetical protein